MSKILIYFVFINIVAFIMYGIDKMKARKSKWRIEKYKYGVPAIIIIQLAAAILLLQSSCTKIDNSTDTVKEDVKSENYEVEEEILEDFVELPDTSAIEGNDADFVILADIVPDIIQEIRYYTTYNFVGRRIPGYEEPVAIMTRKAAKALKNVSDELVEKGYRLKIFDAYRPTTAVRYFSQWARNTGDTLTKRYFYPDVNKADVYQLGYLSSRSAHSRGSTVDLTLFDMNTEKEVDMGGTYDFFGEISHPSYRKGLSDEQIVLRMLLRETMVKYGFKPVSSEWWHFTLRNEPYPETSFDFPVKTSSVKK